MRWLNDVWFRIRTLIAPGQMERELEEEYDQEIFRHILTSVGEQPFRANQNRGLGDLAENFSASTLSFCSGWRSVGCGASGSSAGHAL